MFLFWQAASSQILDCCFAPPRRIFLFLLNMCYFYLDRQHYLKYWINVWNPYFDRYRPEYYIAVLHLLEGYFLKLNAWCDYFWQAALSQIFTMTGGIFFSVCGPLILKASIIPNWTFLCAYFQYTRIANQPLSQTNNKPDVTNMAFVEGVRGSTSCNVQAVIWAPELDVGPLGQQPITGNTVLP